MDTDPPRIVAVAARIGDAIVMLPRPHRHGGLSAALKAEGIPRSIVAHAITHHTGFVDSTGQFLTREQAAQVAIASGQVNADAIQHGILFSEDLW